MVLKNKRDVRTLIWLYCSSYNVSTIRSSSGTTVMVVHITVKLMKHMARWQSESFYLLYAHLQAMSVAAKNECGIVLHITAQSYMCALQYLSNVSCLVQNDTAVSLLEFNS